MDRKIMNMVGQREDMTAQEAEILAKMAAQRAKRERQHGEILKWREVPAETPWIVEDIEDFNTNCGPSKIITFYWKGYHHWESFYTFYCRKQDSAEKKCTNICFIVMSLLAFPILSVTVAWFSWPHLIGTEIIYIMAGIGYQPDFFKKFRIICEKAESTGDPGITDFPGHPKDLTNPKYKPFVDNLVAHGLIPETPTTKEVMECAATCNMLSKYKYFKRKNSRKMKL